MATNQAKYYLYRLLREEQRRNNYLTTEQRLETVEYSFEQNTYFSH